jgi:hypothetical protein
MKKFFYFIIIFQCAALLPAQSLSSAENSRRNQIAADIAEKSAFWGESSLWFFNADTGKFLSGLQVDIPNIGSFTTNADGVVSFPTPPDGNYSFTTSKQGFMVLEDSFRVLMGGIIFYKYSIPPITDLNYVKIVLDWGKTPQDLDLHVEKESQYHISYWAMKKSADGTAWLDRDDVSGFGPETVTITKIDNNAVYRIYVHNYTNRNQASGNQLSNSQAVVRIYSDNRLKETLTITKGRPGVYWDAFEISRGQIRRVNNYR